MRTKAEIKTLFDAMRSDFTTMAEHGDNEQALLQELLTCDDKILQIYKDTFLPE